MATSVKAFDPRGTLFTEVAPYGNLSTIKARLQFASGIVVGGDGDDALAATGEVILGVLPEGLTLEDAKVVISVAATATSTFSLGFKYIDSDLSAENKLAYFIKAGGVASSKATLRANGEDGLVTLKAPAYLVWTNGVAAQAGAGTIDFIITGEYKGKQ